MANMTSYLVFWIVMFVILGAFWYVVDRRFGQGVYRFWYRLTHENPLPNDVRRGFVYNRKTRHKAFMAAVLSTAQSVVTVMNIEQVNLLVELILWIVEVPVTLLGFGIGPWVYKLWNRKDEVFDAIDDLESGEKSIIDLAKGKKGKSEREAEKKTKREELEAELDAEMQRIREEKEKSASDEKDSSKKGGDDDVDPRDMIRRYTKR